MSAPVDVERVTVFANDNQIKGVSDGDPFPQYCLTQRCAFFQIVNRGYVVVEVAIVCRERKQNGFQLGADDAGLAESAGKISH